MLGSCTATHLSQCLTIALVESMSVPSMSERIPEKVCVDAGPEKRSFETDVEDRRDRAVMPEAAIARIIRSRMSGSRDLMGQR